MYHSIIFGTNVTDMISDLFKIPLLEGEVRTPVYNTWESWHLIPSSRPVIPPPPLKSKSVEIPGADGQLDLTEIIAGAPLFGNRSGSLDFYVKPDWWNPSTNRWDGWDWTTAYQTIMGLIHGKRMYMILEDDPGYYYSGRFSVDSWKSNKDFSQITLKFDMDPFKWAIESTLDDWLWDPFDFETGYAEDNTLVDIEAVLPEQGTAWPSFTIANGARRGMLRVKYTPNAGSSEPLYFHRVGDDQTNTPSVSNTNGAYQTLLGLFVQPGENTISYKGDGTFSIEYRRSEF